VVLTTVRAPKNSAVYGDREAVGCFRFGGKVMAISRTASGICNLMSFDPPGPIDFWFVCDRAGLLALLKWFEVDLVQGPHHVAACMEALGF
jgi:hypothetical protein